LAVTHNPVLRWKLARLGRALFGGNKFYLQFLIIPCVFLITAMQEFHAAGRGTPMPKMPRAAW